MAENRYEAAVRACYSTWANTYHDDYYGARADYPPVHVPIIRQLLGDHGAKRVLDAGCGPASLLRELAAPELDLYGFDLTPEMVEEGDRVLRTQGVPSGRVWQGSVVDRHSFRAPDGTAEFDAALCVGVLPHVPESDDVTVMQNLRAAVRPGGRVVLQARNQLFALFTLNRYSLDLFMGELIGADDLRDRAGEDRDAIDAALAEVEARFRRDLPPIRQGEDGSPGYDEVLSRVHNPIVMERTFRRVGFEDVQVLFYHYHRLPPMAVPHLPTRAVEESLRMEDPLDWRGHLMASSFLLTGARGQ